MSDERDLKTSLKNFKQITQATKRPTSGQMQRQAAKDAVKQSAERKGKGKGLPEGAMLKILMGVAAVGVLVLAIQHFTKEDDPLQGPRAGAKAGALQAQKDFKEGRRYLHTIEDKKLGGVKDQGKDWRKELRKLKPQGVYIQHHRSSSGPEFEEWVDAYNTEMLPKLQEAYGAGFLDLTKPN